MFNSPIPLHTFLKKIKTVNLIQRLFFWTRIKNELINAVSVLSRMDMNPQNTKKLNPSSERRTKTIDNKQLQQDVNQLSLQIESSGVVTDDLSEKLNRVRLYRE